LATQVISKSWFYTIEYILSAGFNLRSFVAIATQRVAALRKLARLQNEFRGDVQDKKRRRRILKNKTFALAFDLLSVAIVSFLTPITIVMFGSPFSSRQLIIHLTVLLPVCAILSLILAISLYSNLRFEHKVKPMKTRASAGHKLMDTESSCGTGMSVIEKSEAPGNHAKDGLFSNFSDVDT
jgi:hypothetical protein